MNTFFIFSAEYLFLLPVIILGGYFFAKSWREWGRLALFAIPTGLLTYLLGFVGSLLYYDPRPFVVSHFTPLISHTADNGFPSDHTLLVAAFATVGMYWNKWLGVVLWAITLLVAVSRVYVGVHHFVDVFASMVFALIAVFVWRLIMYRLWKT